MHAEEAASFAAPFLFAALMMIFAALNDKRDSYRHVLRRTV